MADTIKQEVWKDIPHYEGKYMASTEGRIWGIKRNNILKPGVVDRYRNRLQVQLFDKYGKKHNESVSRLIALTFIPNPEHLPEVNHIDENPFNNNVDNLEWCTRKYNVNYGTRTERAAKSMTGNRNYTRSKPVNQLDLQGNIINSFETITQANIALGIDKDSANIGRVCAGKRKTAYGFKWEYKK